MVFSSGPCLTFNLHHDRAVRLFVTHLELRTCSACVRKVNLMIVSEAPGPAGPSVAPHLLLKPQQCRRLQAGPQISHDDGEEQCTAQLQGPRLNREVQVSPGTLRHENLSTLVFVSH